MSLNLDYFLFFLLSLFPSFLASEPSLNLDYLRLIFLKLLKFGFFFFLFQMVPCLLAPYFGLHLDNLFFFLLNLFSSLVASHLGLDFSDLFFLPFASNFLLEMDRILHLFESLELSLALELFVFVWLDRLRAELLLGKVSSIQKHFLIGHRYRRSKDITHGKISISHYLLFQSALHLLRHLSLLFLFFFLFIFLGCLRHLLLSS